MRDLLTNIKKAIEILNKNKNLTIQLTATDLKINDELPVGVSRAEYEESIKYAINELLFTADNLAINFDCTFHIDDLRVEEYNSTKYMEAMQRIIKEIYDRYKWALTIGASVSSNVGTLGNYGAAITSSYPTWNTLNASIQNSAFSKVCVCDDMEVKGIIDADDIKVNGGQLSVSSELDDLKKRNSALECELDLLKAILKSKGVLD